MRDTIDILIIAILVLLIIGCAPAAKNYIVTKSDLAINITNCMDGISVVYTTLKNANCISSTDSLSDNCQVIFYKDAIGLKMKVTRKE